MDRLQLKQQFIDYFNQYHSKIDWSLFKCEIDLHLLKKGQHLFQQGDDAKRLYFLNSGLVRYCNVSDKGKEYTQSIAKAPRVVGSTRAMTLGTPALFSIEAVTDSIAISFPWDIFYQQMSQDLGFMKAYATFLETIFIQKELKESSIIHLSATQRYLNFCRDFPELPGTMPQQQIASYIGITPIALSRIRARIKESAGSR
ncbi:Crp/Fnr family transcriptional regulator [Marinomonas piezotolerans]|uniref:Crp/Fnr family transcriptional regulator n=1 Tax=Marinomonas piezotolerans TaxID=2213058 RepID=A0A370U4V1_9GAMM|nr:Crp/Fnr family transcriptional regulator [Marinomonas piezotolerans]RDL42801.1 Crp/Fnr family transcriptional regulator [Marinomonas piezotolerans]